MKFAGLLFICVLGGAVVIGFNQMHEVQSVGVDTSSATLKNTSKANVKNKQKAKTVKEEVPQETKINSDRNFLAEKP